MTCSFYTVKYLFFTQNVKPTLCKDVQNMFKKVALSKKRFALLNFRDIQFIIDQLLNGKNANDLNTLNKIKNILEKRT